jgi:hypothetical protein
LLSTQINLLPWLFVLQMLNAAQVSRDEYDSMVDLFLLLEDSWTHPWWLAHNSLPWRLNIKRRGVKNVDTKCPVCQRLDEDWMNAFSPSHDKKIEFLFEWARQFLLICTNLVLG